MNMHRSSSIRHCACTALAFGSLFLTSASFAAGPDVTYQDISSISNTGVLAGIRGYALGSHTCNIGNQNLLWTSDGTPGLAMNGYRLYNGRLEQLGQGWVKTACCAAAGNGCGLGCNGVGGQLLGAGCLDVYSAGWNAIQGNLSPRNKINPFTGQFTGPIGTSGTISGHLQMAESDLAAANFPGALYFVEGHYIADDDANDSAGNHLNNASHRRVTVGATFGLTLQGSTVVGQPAIHAWKAHGLGLNTPDPTINIVNTDVPSEGRFIVGSKAKDNGNGTWRYEYAVYNFNSDRAGGSFSVPVPKSAIVSNVGFKDVNYHSGEPYTNTDWIASNAGGSVKWDSPQTFDANPNSNALRWGTMYNFWFDANLPPTNGEATIGLFKPHTPSSVQTPVPVPQPQTCPPDIAPVGGDGTVNVSDLLAVISAWGPCPATPECPADLAPKGGNQIINVEDLLAVTAAWGDCG